MADTRTNTSPNPEPGERYSKNYEPATIEPRWYGEWLRRGYFHADAQAPKAPFAIVIPPPNVTGVLHMGHALGCTIEDIFTRWKRMAAYNAMWLPGTDHAGIATQMVVERQLRETEKKSRHDIGREEFVKRVWSWRQQSGDQILQQLKRLGCSLDWDRLKFTMEPSYSEAVIEAFVRLHEEGLIYRAKRLINWCVSCRTALSDLEVDYEEGKQAELYEFAYPLLDGSGEVVVATTRPETMLGDTAVAVHPDDPRHQAKIGRKIQNPITGYFFNVIADPILVDPTFGTGAVKVTPAHDPNDFESGQRNGLTNISIFDEAGVVTAAGGPFAGLDRFAARKAVKARLKELGLERGSKPYVHAVGHCQRCETIVEPMLSTQWFVKMEPLARPAIEAVEQGKTRFVPESWSKTYFHWMRNIRDWCISRQLWWGHRIPAWTCTALRQDHGGSGGADRLRRLRSGQPQARRRCARHLVLILALAVRDAGLAQGDPRAQDLLSDQRARYRVRHPVLLGRSHDDGGPALHEEGALQDRVPAHDGHGREGRQDVEGEGEHDRSPDRHRQVRGRRAAVRAGLAGHPRIPGEEHQVLDEQRRGRAPLRHQDLERQPVRA
jgi:valyl-tRNA synthetase